MHNDRDTYGQDDGIPVPSARTPGSWQHLLTGETQPFQRMTHDDIHRIIRQCVLPGGNGSETTQASAAPAPVTFDGQFYPHLLNLISYGIVVTVGGRCRWFNQSFADIFGYRREELFNKRLDLVGRPEEASLLQPVQGASSDGRANRVSYRARAKCKDGRRIFIAVTAGRIDMGGTPGILLTVNDITEQYHTERALQHREATLRSVLTAAPIGIGLVHDRIISWVSDRTNEMLGYEQDELIGKSARMLYPDDAEFERVGREKYDQIHETGTGQVDTCWMRKDSEIIHVRLRSTPLDRSDWSAGVTFTAMDITSLVRAEGDLARSHEELLHEQDELKNKNVTLRGVLDHIEEEKMAIREQIADIIDHILSPALRKLVDSEGQVNIYNYKLLTDGLRELADASGGVMRHYAKLTPREVETCNLIKLGATSKQIADELFISIGTVKRHRETIRRKLGIANKNVNLFMYLKNL